MKSSDSMNPINRVLRPLLILAVLAMGCSSKGDGNGQERPAVHSLAISPSNSSIAKGTSQPFTLLGIHSDGSTVDLSTQADWSTEDVAGSGVADITSSGLATGHAEGTTAIRASYEGQSVATNLTVTAATLVTLALSPSNPSLAKGFRQQFAVTGTFSDGSTQDLTAQSSFGSMDEVGNN